MTALSLTWRVQEISQVGESAVQLHVITPVLAAIDLLGNPSDPPRKGPLRNRLSLGSIQD